MQVETTWQQVILAGGCFWCLEAAFNRLKGVHQALSGYSGGQVYAPTYRQVCSGSTGHAEAIQLRFDPAQLSFNDVLEIFFALHNPTTLNRQGNDIGTQYRSAVFYHDETQAQLARAMIARLNALQLWDAPIVTEVVPAAPFYPAEDEHQGYFNTHPNEAYCIAVVSPKFAAFRKKFAQYLKP